VWSGVFCPIGPRVGPPGMRNRGPRSDGRPPPIFAAIFFMQDQSFDAGQRGACWRTQLRTSRSGRVTLCSWRNRAPRRCSLHPTPILSTLLGAVGICHTRQYFSCTHRSSAPRHDQNTTKELLSPVWARRRMLGPPRQDRAIRSESSILALTRPPVADPLGGIR